MKLLALDTATECCSVALWIDGESRWREARAERGHGERVLGMIDELLGEGAMSLGRLDAIAFGAGPGAFTGVRLAASITQGLAFSAGLPVLPVSTLRATAQQALWPPLEAPPNAASQVLVCQDARMREVYWAVFERNQGIAIGATPEAVGSPAAVVAALRAYERASDAARRLCGAGTGFAVYPELAAGLAGRLQPILGELLPHAREVALLAAHAGLAAALPPGEAQPVYLRNDVAAIPAARPAGTL